MIDMSNEFELYILNNIILNTSFDHDYWNKFLRSILENTNVKFKNRLAIEYIVNEFRNFKYVDLDSAKFMSFDDYDDLDIPFELLYKKQAYEGFKTTSSIGELLSKRSDFRYLFNEFGISYKKDEGLVYCDVNYNLYSYLIDMNFELKNIYGEFKLEGFSNNFRLNAINHIEKLNLKKNIYLDNLKTVGNILITLSSDVEELVLPNLIMANSILIHGKKIKKVYLPKLKNINSININHSHLLEEVYICSLEKISGLFTFKFTDNLKKVNLNSLKLTKSNLVNVKNYSNSGLNLNKKNISGFNNYE